MKDPITRFLVSGTDKQLTDFYFATPNLNPIERRKQTWLFTSFPEDREYAIGVAREIGVTMQEIKFRGSRETYKMIIKGGHAGWMSQSKG